VRSSGEGARHVVFRALVAARDAANQHPALCRLVRAHNRAQVLGPRTPFPCFVLPSL